MRSRYLDDHNQNDLRSHLVVPGRGEVFEVAFEDARRILDDAKLDRVVHADEDEDGAQVDELDGGDASDQVDDVLGLVDGPGERGS